MKYLKIIFLLFVITQTLHGYCQDSLDEEVFLTSSCDKIISQGKNEVERKELQRQFWLLSGMVNDLGRYRQLYLTEKNIINLFPTVYYHTTISAMKLLINKKFAYPIEEMRLMMAFYEAYKYNRINWDKGSYNLVESHWKKHFESCDSYEKKVSILEFDKYTCIISGYYLSSAVDAHGKYDFPRAIRWAYQNRFDKNIPLSDSKYMNDFFMQDNLFEDSNARVNLDMIKVKNCYERYIKLNTNTLDSKTLSSLININDFILVLDKFGLQLPGEKIYIATNIIEWFREHFPSPQKVISLRHKAWELAFTKEQIVGIDGKIMIEQPQIAKNELIEKGQTLCPPTDNAYIEQVLANINKNSNKQIVAETPINSTTTLTKDNSLTGGSTPEALGKLMFKAITSNDRKLWNSLIHPINKNKSAIEESFDWIRDKFEENGVTDISKIVFSRVKFKTEAYGGDDNGIYQVNGEFKGEQIRRFFQVEFTYKNREFVGYIGDIGILTYQKKNFLMMQPSSLKFYRK